jgi:hypothetical protein
MKKLKSDCSFTNDELLQSTVLLSIFYINKCLKKISIGTEVYLVHHYILKRERKRKREKDTEINFRWERTSPISRIYRYAYLLKCKVSFVLLAKIDFKTDVVNFTLFITLLLSSHVILVPSKRWIRKIRFIDKKNNEFYDILLIDNMIINSRNRGCYVSLIQS